MASIFATMAFHWAARNDRYPEQLTEGLEPHRAQKLYYCTASFILPDRQPVSPPPSTATIDIAPFLETKIKATQAHRTQAPLMELFAKDDAHNSAPWNCFIWLQPTVRQRWQLRQTFSPVLKNNYSGSGSGSLSVFSRSPDMKSTPIPTPTADAFGVACALNARKEYILIDIAQSTSVV